VVSVHGIRGLNLLQSSLTNFCPLERILGRFHAFGCRPLAPPPAGRSGAV
jgi:hypothetical protein